jgi:uncharacterized protein involved in outer membrane biogenesis
MKKKIIFGVIAILIVFVVIASLVIGAYLGEIVKAGLENVGPKLTQTSVTVSTVNVSLLAGSAGIKGLVLGNPSGYKTPQSISVSNAAVSLSPGSLLGDKIVIRSIEVRAPEITFEGNPLGDNNLMQILHNVTPATAAVDKSTNAPAAATPDEKKAAKKLEVDDFLISGAVVHANITGLVNKQITLSIPDIHLANLGTGTNGITAADLTQVALSEITAQTIKALVSNVSELGKDAVNAAKGAAQDAVNNALHNGTNTVNENVNQLKKGLGNLLGK